MAVRRALGAAPALLPAMPPLVQVAGMDTIMDTALATEAELLQIQKMRPFATEAELVQIQNSMKEKATGAGAGAGLLPLPQLPLVINSGGVPPLASGGAELIPPPMLSLLSTVFEKN